MFLKKSIVLINVIHYFVVVKSIDIHVYPGNQHQLETDYLNGIVMENKNLYEYKICKNDAAYKDMRNRIVATICKATLDTLRFITKDYGDNVHVYYPLLKNEESICKTHYVQMMTNPRKELQKMISCHNRPAIIDASTLNSDNVKLTAHIFPVDESNRSWLLFDCMEEQKPCTLKSRFTNKHAWENFIPKILFILPPPLSVNTEYAIYSELLDFYKKWNRVIENAAHVLHRVNMNSFRILCSNIIGIAEWNLNRVASKPPPESNILLFSVPKSNNEIQKLNGLSYSCDNFIIVKGLSLFVGHGDFTIILAQKVPNTEHYKIIKIVTNLFTEHLDDIFF